MATRHEVHDQLITDPAYRLARLEGNVVNMQLVLRANGFGHTMQHGEIMVAYRSGREEFVHNDDPSRVIIMTTPSVYRGGKTTGADVVWYTVAGKGNLKYTMSTSDLANYERV